MLSAADILKDVETQRVQFVALWFTDITGLVKSVMIPAGELANVFENGSHFTLRTDGDSDTLASLSAL